MTSLHGRVALVTGAGRGLGREMARWFAEAGASVVICARTPGGIDALAAELETQGTEVLAATCDVADPDDVEQLVHAALARFGRIDIAVANAAVLGPVGPIGDLDPREIAHTLTVNVAGVAALVRSVVAPMAAQGFGRILTMSGGGVGGPGLPARVSAYVASKGAVMLLTEALALELPDGITINSVAPGAVPTGFMDEVVQAGPEIAGVALFATVQATTMPDLTPLRDLVLYLVDSDAAWLTGRCLSARWDPPQALEAARVAGVTAARYRLRRIDEDLYEDRSGPPA